MKHIDFTPFSFTSIIDEARLEVIDKAMSIAYHNGESSFESIQIVLKILEETDITEEELLIAALQTLFVHTDIVHKNPDFFLSKYPNFFKT